MRLNRNIGQPLKIRGVLHVLLCMIVFVLVHQLPKLITSLRVFLATVVFQYAGFCYNTTMWFCAVQVPILSQARFRSYPFSQD